jgi:hypothetical protein
MSNVLVLPHSASAGNEASAPMFGDYQVKGFLTNYSKISTTAGEGGSY